MRTGEGFCGWEGQKSLYMDYCSVFIHESQERLTADWADGWLFRLGKFC
jgi:hypothetical protein